MKKIYAPNEFKGIIKKLPKKVGAAGLVGKVSSMAFKPGSYISTVGKSAAVKNAALNSDLQATLLKGKLVNKEVASGAKALSKNFVSKPIAGNAGKIAGAAGKTSLAGLGAVALAAGIGIHKIRKAKKEVDKTVGEVYSAVDKVNKSGQELQEYLKKKKKETGLSLMQRRDQRMKAKEAEENRKFKAKMSSTDYRMWK